MVSSIEGKDEAVTTEARLGADWNRVVARRTFLKGVGMLGATAVVPGALLAGTASADVSITEGDVAILQFLAAAETLETDLWQQYAELGGEDGGNPAYLQALENIDDDMPDYISDNTGDEASHERFLNAYLKSKGADPVHLDEFRTLSSSKATGAKDRKRLTSLMNLDVDTSWYTRYRAHGNPDFGATFPQAVNIKGEPAIPLDDKDTPPDQDQPVPPVTARQRRMQAIANTASFHFAFIEQGGASLYTAMSLKCSSLEVLRIVVSIGGVEVDHFGLWHDKAGAAVKPPLAGVTDPETGVTFPDLEDPPFGGALFDPAHVLPQPCDFIDTSLPGCSVIRPSSVQNAGAVAAVKALTADGLFRGQSQRFFDKLMGLATAADAAQRQLG